MDKKREGQGRTKSKLKASYSTLLKNEGQDGGSCLNLSGHGHHSTTYLSRDEKSLTEETRLSREWRRNKFARSVTSTIDCYPSSSQDKPEMKHHLEEVFIMPSKQNYLID